MSDLLKRKIVAREPAYGVWCALDSIAVLEAVGTLEPDWVLVDGEHGLTSADACLPQLAALGASRASAIVRLPRADPTLCGRVLDAGADGVLVPRVDDAETAARMVAGCRYPPQGARGIGPHRASRYFSKTPEYLASANHRVVVMVQIESGRAVEAIDEIVAVDGLDGVFIGPNDLAASLGHFGELGAPAVREAATRVLERATAAGKAAGYYCTSARDARARVEQGFRVVNVGHDLGSLVTSLGRALRDARESQSDDG